MVIDGIFDRMKQASLNSTAQMHCRSVPKTALGTEASLRTTGAHPDMVHSLLLLATANANVTVTNLLKAYSAAQVKRAVD